jgi:hypothetical protein
VLAVTLSKPAEKSDKTMAEQLADLATLVTECGAFQNRVVLV